MDANVDPADVADMIVTKYSLNLFTESGESVFKLLDEDMNSSMQIGSGGGDVNDRFKPKYQSKLEETVADETLNLTLAAGNTSNLSMNRSRQQYTGRDILDEITSPFPIHQENINIKTINGIGKCLSIQTVYNFTS